MNATKDELAVLFTEWERRYREEPARFMSDVERFTQWMPTTYGELCAAYLLLLVEELQAPQ
jgi:hypothetical protein